MDAAIGPESWLMMKSSSKHLSGCEKAIILVGSRSSRSVVWVCVVEKVWSYALCRVSLCVSSCGAMRRV